MAQAKFFNKGILKGTISKSDLIEYDSKQGKNKFLAVEVSTGGSNRVKATIFNTKSNPDKAKELFEKFPIGSKVEISGKVSEREYENKQGKTSIDRSLSGLNISPMKPDDTDNATFIIQGIVDRIREIEDGAEVTVIVDASYVNDSTKEKVEQEEVFTLFADECAMEIMDDHDIEKGCNAKFKGYIINKLVFDEFGDIKETVQMFKIAQIEAVIPADEIETMEEAPSFL